MLQSIEAIIDQDGKIQVPGQIALPRLRRVIITVLDDESPDDEANLALLDDAVLARDWECSEEDEAWSHLDQLSSL